MITNPIKHVIKRSAQWACSTFGPHTRTPRRPSLLVLMYHRVLPPDDERVQLEEPGMIVTPLTFRKHLNLIRQYFQPVHLEDWVHRCTTGDSLPDRACAITFDDGWADNFEFAFPALQEAHIPATIFLVTDMVGTDKMFWPELLARILAVLCDVEAKQTDHPSLHWLCQLLPKPLDKLQRRPGPEELAIVINNAKSFTEDEINRQLACLVKALDLPVSPGQPSLLNWDEISEMTSTGLVQVASHTRRHTRLTVNISENMATDEIVGSKALIEEKTGRAINTFCFPNGDYTPQSLEVVRQHYHCAVTTQNGWNSCGDDMHLLRRIAIHEDIAHDRTAFLSRISGWL